MMIFTVSNDDTISRNITYIPWADGTVLCNIFWLQQDCVTVAHGQFPVTLHNGETKTYIVNSTLSMLLNDITE
jgi:alpha-amylase